MKKVGLAWGAVVAAVVCGATAQAAPKTAAAGTAGAAGAGATAPSAGSATTPTAPSSQPAAPVPVAPDASAVPAPDAVAPPAPPAAEEEAQAEEEARAEAKEREAARKRVRRRRAQLEAEAEAEAEEEEEEAERRREVERPRPQLREWRLVGRHFLLGVERVTNIIGWSATQTVEVNAVPGFGTSQTVDLERAGTDVSFMGSGGVSTNLFSVPRVAFDGMFANGLTLGGSIGYLVASGEHQALSGFSTTQTVKIEDPTASLFVFAPRLGIMIQASPYMGVWLRGGISRLSASTEAREIDDSTGEQLTSTVTSTLTLVNLTLDPQLVFAPVPHVGITLGALLDIGVSGTLERSTSPQERDYKQSAYGVTGGLVAIF